MTNPNSVFYVSQHDTLKRLIAAALAVFNDPDTRPETMDADAKMKALGEAIKAAGGDLGL